MPPPESRVCDTCGHITAMATGEWRIAPTKTMGGLTVIGYQREYQCADPECGTITWVSSGRQRPMA